MRSLLPLGSLWAVASNTSPSSDIDCCTCNAQGKQTYLGTFDNPESAAKRYNEAAIEHHGDKAVCNRLPGRTSPEGPRLVMPEGGERGKEPANNESLPAGLVGSKPAAVRETARSQGNGPHGQVTAQM